MTFRNMATWTEINHHINYLNLTIKFDYEYWEKSVHFLDTTIYMYFNDKHQLESELYIKPTYKTLLLEVLSTAKRNDTNGLSQVTKN